MVRLIPEPKQYIEKDGYSAEFGAIRLLSADDVNSDLAVELQELLELRFYDRKEIEIAGNVGYELYAVPTLEGVPSDNPDMLKEQGYQLEVAENRTHIYFENIHGFINGVTSFKKLMVKRGTGYCLPICEIVDYPSIPVRAVAPPMSWYAGYGRIGFDTQLFGKEKWFEYLNTCVDDKINQMNIVMYGYWPFEFEEYPETVFRDIPVKIWNGENNQFLDISYTHPNLIENFLKNS